MFVSLISPDLHPCSTVLGSDNFLHLSYTAFMKHLRPIPTVFLIKSCIHVSLPFSHTCIHAAPSSAHILCISIFPTLHQCSTSASLLLVTSVSCYTAFMQHLSILVTVSAPRHAYMFLSLISPDLHPCSTILSSFNMQPLSLIATVSAPSHMFVSPISPDLHPCSTVLSSFKLHHQLSYTASLQHISMFVSPFPQTCIHAAPSLVHLICSTSD